MTEEKKTIRNNNEVVYLTIDHVVPKDWLRDDMSRTNVILVASHHDHHSKMWAAHEWDEVNTEHKVREAIDEAIERLHAAAAAAPSPQPTPYSPAAPITPSRGFGALLKLLTPHSTFKQVIAPQLVDLCDAHAEALGKGRPGLARWIVIRESVAIVCRLVKWPMIALFELIRTYLDFR